MTKKSKIRIRRILEKHCVMKEAEFFRITADEYGDTAGVEKYASCMAYVSQLLHRYNPYIDLRTEDLNSFYRRRTPMAIIPYENAPDIKKYDVMRIEDAEYTVSFVEDMKGYYYLLSLIPKE